MEEEKQNKNARSTVKYNFFNLNSLHTRTHARTHARTRVFRFSNYSEMREFIQLESSSPCKFGLYHPMFVSKIIIIATTQEEEEEKEEEYFLNAKSCP